MIEFRQLRVQEMGSIVRLDFQIVGPQGTTEATIFAPSKKWKESHTAQAEEEI